MGLTLKFNSIKNDSKGISYIMSVIFMTAVIVSLAFIVYFRGREQILSSERSYSEVILFSSERVQERFIVENVWSNLTRPTNRSVILYVRNVGANPVTIDKVYLENGLCNVTGPPTGSLFLGIGGGGYIVANCTISGVSLTRGSSYFVKISSTRGNTFGIYYTA